MREQFTEGPWITEVFSDKSQVHVYSADYNYTLHHQKKFFGLELTGTDLANAALIECAPAMYEMLKWLSVAVLKDGSIAHKNAVELLAKARGES